MNEPDSLPKEFGLCSSRSLVFPLRMRFCAKFLVDAVMSFSGLLSARWLYGTWLSLFYRSRFWGGEFDR